MSQPMFVLDEDPAQEPFSLDNFLQNNEDLPDEEKNIVRGLAVGDSHRFGGGAAPDFTIRRVS